MAYVYTRNTCTTLQGMKAMKVVLNLPTHSFWVNVVCGTSSLLGGACGTLCVILILMSFNSGSVKIKDTTVRTESRERKQKFKACVYTSVPHSLVVEKEKSVSQRMGWTHRLLGRACSTCLMVEKTGHFSQNSPLFCMLKW